MFVIVNINSSPRIIIVGLEFLKQNLQYGSNNIQRILFQVIYFNEKLVFTSFNFK
jgi:hypothetical protein